MRHERGMRRFAGTALVLVFLFGCSGAPSSGATPTVAIAAPPPEAPTTTSTASDPEPEAANDGPGDGDPPLPDCEPLVDEAKGGTHASVDDCRGVQAKLFSAYSLCQPDLTMNLETEATFGAADCMEEVVNAREKALSASLPAAAAATIKAASDSVSAEVANYCGGECPRPWAATCVFESLRCKAETLDFALAGKLDLPATNKKYAADHPLDAQAKALCALPKSAWKQGAAPSNCRARALAQFERYADPTTECAGP